MELEKKLLKFQIIFNMMKEQMEKFNLLTIENFNLTYYDEYNQVYNNIYKDKKRFDYRLNKFNLSYLSLTNKRNLISPMEVDEHCYVRSKEFPFLVFELSIQNEKALILLHYYDITKPINLEDFIWLASSSNKSQFFQNLVSNNHYIHEIERRMIFTLRSYLKRLTDFQMMKIE